LANVVYARSVILDFENGELSPCEVPILFPGLRMVVTNSYNHSNEKPRFRVILPTDEKMTTEVYGLMFNRIADKIEEAGYWIKRGRETKSSNRPNSRPSGIDWSKSPASSLFYLPCQAQNPADSFFIDCAGDSRRVLSPSLWLQHMPIEAKPEFEDRPNDNPKPIDEAKVLAATNIWRGSPAFQGEGDAMFFGFARSLRAAGMDSIQIERVLHQEAHYARHPQERLSQIPSIMGSLKRYVRQKP
jgi:hypothetical protein